MTGDARLVLHGYWRSTASYRVRMALNFKGLDFRQVTHDLRVGAQRRDDYVALAPLGLVPALEADGMVLTQSSAILEWLEERFPEPPLLPTDSASRALIRSMAATIGCDVHPLNNLRVLNALRANFDASAAQVDHWIARWIRDAFGALDVLIGRYGGNFAFGDLPTLADCYLVPQVYSAERFKVDLSPFARLRAVAQHARGITAFAAAHPDLQPDAA